ncbi:hypothetical protein EJ08DRAFT_421975 [Tothia fuscella]|uniref:Uncharacterized protein n=1 Tax=Tothia fuscella TaxID=1048955 RepID=A0A9P4TVE5_9PEZI|nr:hypothetical protein EJ08DRAFT_421975 [Tothia fuscella]
MSSSFVQDAKLSCPSGGKWYVCDSTQKTKFVGCCTKDPCSEGCAQSDIRPASFDPTFNGTFADQRCDIGSAFYTCAKTDPPFLGCCKSNPCSAPSGKCPGPNLTQTFLSDNATAAADFTGDLLPNITTTTASASSSASATISASASSSASALPVTSGHVHISTGGIIGIAVGGGILLLGFIAVISVLLQRRSKSCRVGYPTDGIIPFVGLSSHSSTPEPLIRGPTPDVSSYCGSTSTHHSFQPSTISSPAPSTNAHDPEHLLGSGFASVSLVPKATPPMPQGYSELDGSSVGLVPYGNDATAASAPDGGSGTYLRPTYMPYRSS